MHLPIEAECGVFYKSDSEIAKDENSFNKILRGKYSTNRIF